MSKRQQLWSDLAGSLKLKCAKSDHSCECAYTPGGWAHRQRVSTTFLTRKISVTNFSCAPDRDSNLGIVGLESRRSYQLSSHPVTPYTSRVWFQFVLHGTLSLSLCLSRSPLLPHSPALSHTHANMHAHTFHFHTPSSS